MQAYQQSGSGDRCIGVFDSGLGGLTVVREISRLLPGEDIVYFGDTARVPYGTKSLPTIRRFAAEIFAFLMNHAPKMIVVACNTASAAAVDQLRAASPVEVIDVITPGSAEAVAATAGAVAVIATEATINSGAYVRAIRALDESRQVFSQACPLLVPIVEEGRDEFDPIVLAVLSDYLRELQRRRPGAMILGCTHYPLISGAIAKLMGPDVALISSAAAAARLVQKRLCMSDMQSTRSCGGRLSCFTTDNADRFLRLGERFGRRKIDSIEQVKTDELEACAASYKTDGRLLRHDEVEKA